MKTIGLIGGMSWESTLLYYQTINREIGRRLGGLHSGKVLLHSMDFEAVVRGQKAGEWEALAAMLAEAGRGLVAAGADCLLIGTNTMHRVAPEVQAAVDVPLLHIADVTAAAISAAGCTKVALLGTLYTMEQPFYVEHLAAKGIECIMPPEDHRAEVHRIIFEELCKGQITAASRQSLQDIIAHACARGAQGAVLGCTELPLSLRQSDVDVPLFDTTELHALAAVDFALKDVPRAALAA
ncbi:MAG: aspartate/glutamate racemase family protein [Ideonella sp.]|nr:aspartate/glutamate racemase family protein [Ideonella sp.]